jgi:hypothetical protein
MVFISRVLILAPALPKGYIHTCLNLAVPIVYRRLTGLLGSSPYGARNVT